MPDVTETEETGSSRSPRPDASKENAHGFLKDYEGPLSPDEARSAAGFRFIIAELQRRQGDIDELKEFRSKFYDASEKNAILRTASRPNKITEIVGSISLSMGSLVLGLAAKTDKADMMFFILAAVAVVLIMSGIGAVVGRSFMGGKS